MNFLSRQAPTVTHRLRYAALSILVTLSFGLSYSATAGGVAPVFVGATTNLSLYRSASATDIRDLLHISDSDNGQTLTWSLNGAPSHGTLAFSGATALSGGNDIAPGGVITYLPTNAYFGPDSFIVEVSDGTATATRKISVTVDSDTASTGSGSPSAVNNTQPSATLTWLIATQGIYPDGADGIASVDSYLGEIRLVSCDSGAISGGWLPCDGRLLNINVNQALFALLGTAFGGDGRTQFALPDLRGRVPVGIGQGDGLSDRVLGASGGAEEFTLATANLPPHSHSYILGNTGLAGSGTGIDNMQPWLALNLCIVRNGQFDSMAWVRIFAFDFTPGGHYAANGALHAIASETALFSLLGTTYGGDGRTTFALPDLRGRTPIGVGTGGGLTTRTLGEAGGSEEIALLESEIPAHTHTYSDGITGSTGGNQPHDTMQPFLALNVAVSSVGIFGHIGEGTLPGIGEVRIWATDYAIRDGVWFPCDGSLKPISEQETLFTLIGTIYGGDGQSTFALPDASGRAFVDPGQGAGLTSHILGQKWGSEIETVGLAQLPAHTHFFNAVPTDISLSSNSVNQSDGVNAIVGTLSTTDADLGDSQTYSLVSGTGSANNSSFNISGTTLRATNATSMPPGVYSVRIQSDDGNAGVYAEAFSVTVVDDIAPLITSVSAPVNGSYKAGQNLDFTVRFTEVVLAAGTPALSLTIGSSARNAAYSSGSGSSNLVFGYTVAAGDNDFDGIASASPVALNGGTLKDAAGHDATLTFTPPDSAAVLVDTVAPDVLSILRQSPSGSNVVSGSATWRVTFSEPVSGVDLNDFLFTQLGGNAFFVNQLISGGPSVYDVTVQYGAGVSPYRLDLKPSGTGIADAASNAISGGYTNGEIYNFDNAGPVVNRVDAPANGTYGPGQALDFPVFFNEPTTITGSPSIELTIGSIARSASYFSGSGSNIVVFRYAVQAGDQDTDGITSTFPIALNGGAIQDAAGNDATLTFISPPLTGVLVDALAPQVVSITRKTPSAQTAVTNTVVFEVTFTKAVTNLAASWFVVTPVGGGLATGTVASVRNGPTVYDVAVSLTGGPGEFRLDAVTNSLVPPTFATGFRGPIGLAFDSAGNLYVANNGNNTVSKVTSGGELNTFATGLANPHGLAFDGAGNLYVANAFGNTVSKVTSGGVVSTFATGFSICTGLAFDGGGNLYVADYANNTVSKVTSGGVVSTFASGFNAPLALAFDGAGNLYVANRDGNTVSKVTSGGEVSTFATGFDGPSGLVFDAAGNLFVANLSDGTVNKVTSDGMVSTFATGFDSPYGLAFDSAGYLYVANNANNTVSKPAIAPVKDLAGNELAGLPFTSGETYLYEPNAAPTDLTLSSSTVNQSAGTNAIVGTLTTTDADSGDTFIYSLEAGEGDTGNNAFNISGPTLRANEPLSLAVGNVSVRIRTDDGHGGIYAKAFSITVTAEVGNRFVGIDFDQSNGLSPTNWTKITERGQTAYLTDESGRKTVLRFTNSAGLTYFNAIPAANTIPMHSTSLQDIGGNLFDFGTNATITTRATGLKSGVTYKIWVFAVRFGGLTDQTVTIEGSGAPITFRQQGGDTNLVVNDSVGSSSNDLSNYAKFVTADINGEISVTVVAGLPLVGPPLFVLAGLAIQGDIDLLPAIDSPLTAAGTNGVSFNYQITASGGTATRFAAVGLPADLSVNAGTGEISGTPTQAGSFSVLLSAANALGDTDSATLTLTIAKAIARVSLTGLIQTYDGIGKEVTVSTIPEWLPVDLTYNHSSTVPTNAGSYEVIGTINDPNYAGSSTNTLEVSQAPLSITAANASRKFGEANPILAGTLLGAVMGDHLGATYSTITTLASPVGTYPITPAVVDPDGRLANYAVALTNGLLTITADDSPIITLATNLVTYTENAAPVRLDVAAIVTDGGSADFDGGTLTITLTANGEATDLLGICDQGTGAGEIGASTNNVSFGGAVFGTWTGGDGTNTLVFSFNTNATPAVVSALLQNLTFASTSELPSINARVAELVITDGDGGTSAPVSLTVEVVAVPDNPILTWADPAAITYGTPLGGTQLDPTASVLGTFEYSPAAGTVLHAGSNQTLTAVFIPDDLVNYNMATSQVRVTVLKAMLTATATGQTRNYGDSNPALTISYTGFVNGDSLAAIDTPPTVSTTATTDNNVGTYPITLTGGDDDNYALNLVDGTLTITTAPLLLVVNDASRLYGLSNPTFTGTILQTRNGDTFNASYSTTAIATSPEGTYLITGTVLDRNNKLTNYSITVTEGLLTIGKVLLTATANNLSRAYGAANPPLTITYTGFLNGDNASTLATAPMASTTATTNSPLGDYPITLAGGADDGYTIVLVNGTLAVGKAPLIITANSLSKPYGAANPVLTLRYAGLVNGETAAVLDVAPTVATTATTDSTAGTYPITLTGGSDDHYAITLAHGALTVVPDAEFGIVFLTAPTTYLRRTPPVKLDPGATFDAGGRPHFGGGQLTVTVISNAVAGDVLAVYHQGTDASLIGLVGDTVFIGEAPFGQMTRAAGPADPLVFDLYPNATPEAIEGLVRDLSFVTTNTVLTARVVELILTDVTGARSWPSRKTMVIDRVPVIPPYSGSLSNLARLPRGAFNGLILRTNDILPERSGYFRLTVQAGLGYSGYFKVGGRRTVFSGRFNDNGHAARLVSLGAFGLELELVPETDQVRGTLTSYRGGGWSSELFGHRAGDANINQAAPLKGTYTLSLPGSADPAIASAGNGYAAATVDALGKMRFTGRLADGQIWNQSALVSSNALFPVSVSLDRQQGVIIGWLKLDGSPGGEVTGTLTWIKPRSSFYPNGFAAELAVSGSRFTPVTSGAPALGWRDGEFQLYGGNLLSPATNQITLSREATLVASTGPIRPLRMALNRRNGVFSGEFLHPLSRRMTRYYGVLLQNRDLGTGFFLGLNQGGLVRLTAGTEEP